MSLHRFVMKTVAPIERQVKNMVARGVLTLLGGIDGLQRAQISINGDEIHNDTEHFQPYGFHSLPPAGATALAMALGGHRDHVAVVCLDDAASRNESVTDSGASAGDVVVFTTGGNWVRLSATDGKLLAKAGGNVLISSPDTIRLEANRLELVAQTSIKWDCGGRGYDYLPTKTDTWETGSVAGLINAITPPEHPPAAAETLP